MLKAATRANSVNPESLHHRTPDPDRERLFRQAGLLTLDCKKV